MKKKFTSRSPPRRGEEDNVPKKSQDGAHREGGLESQRTAAATNGSEKIEIEETAGQRSSVSSGKHHKSKKSKKHSHHHRHRHHHRDGLKSRSRSRSEHKKKKNNNNNKYFD